MLVIKRTSLKDIKIRGCKDLQHPRTLDLPNESYYAKKHLGSFGELLASSCLHRLPLEGDFLSIKEKSPLKGVLPEPWHRALSGWPSSFHRWAQPGVLGPT